MDQMKDYKRIPSEHTLRYKSEATCFNEALPLGNGRIGAMVYGCIEEEKISLNEDTLWSGYPKKMREEDYPSVYRSAGELFEAGQIAEAQKLLEGGFGDYLVQMYLPLADLKVRTDHGKSSQYSRVLELDKAIHTVRYVADGKTFMREAFVSEPYQVMAIRFSCDREGSINLEAVLEGRLRCEYTWEKQFAKERTEDTVGGTGTHRTGNVLFMHGTAPNCEAGYGTSYKSIDAQVYDGNGVSYACAVAVEAKGGSILYGKNSVRVENADEAVIYFAVRTNFVCFDRHPEGEAYKEKCLSDIRRALEAGYETLRRESIRSHRRLYNRCSVSFADDPDTADSCTDERLVHLREGEEDNALYALLFNYGKYLTIAGSRAETQPANLQGIWNDNILPPWNSNYTLNINTEMNYWPTLPMGLFECYEPFVRFVEELAESGKETAELYYGVKKGWVCHHSSDIWRLTHPGTNRLKGNAQWGFWNMASGWLSVMLWNYYRYTLDKAYLKRIYPVIEGAAQFYKELLVEYDGELILSLSTSPENNYVERGTKRSLSEDGAPANQDQAAGEVHAIDKSTAMTQEILYDLFSAVSEAQDILGLGNEYQKLISRLKRPAIQQNGELCEWHTEHEVWDVHHRHVSHLYGLFPSNQFSGNTELLEACKKVLESRGDGGTGWSLAWKINLWARLGDGERALRLLKNQLRLVPAEEDGHDVGGGSYPNLFCAHPPFQIDGNFGAASGIIQMLVQYGKDGSPVLLPALPKEWKCGSVSNLYLPGGKCVSFAWKDGQIVWSKVEACKGEE